MTVRGFFEDVWLAFMAIGAVAGALFPFYLIFEIVLWLLK
jgi:hypothetical protein